MQISTITAMKSVIAVIPHALDEFDGAALVEVDAAIALGVDWLVDARGFTAVAELRRCTTPVWASEAAADVSLVGFDATAGVGRTLQASVHDNNLSQ